MSNNSAGMENSANHSLQSGTEVLHEEESEKTPTQIATSRGSLSTDEFSVRDCETEEETEEIPVEIPVSCVESGVHSAQDTEFIHAAVEEGNYTEVVNLLKGGADVNSLGSTGKFKGLSPLHIAVKGKHHGIAELLVDFKADVDVHDEYGKPPLFFSVENVDVQMTRFLLNNGANVVDDPELLYSAVSRKSNDIAENLLRLGVDVNIRGKYGNTALHLAVLTCCGDIVLCKCSTDTSSSAFIYDEFVKILDLLLRYNADVNLADEEGLTPLHTSAAYGDVKISTLLLSKGAKVDAKAKNGKTPLHLAVANCYKEAVELLLKCGAKADCNDSRWKTPVRLAAEIGYSGILEVFFNYGANVNAKTWSGTTLLHLAAFNGHVKVVELLLAKGAKVNCENASSQTPLQLACKMGYSIVVQNLLAHGACVNATTWFNDSPLHLAVETGQEEIVKSLLKKGAKMDCKDSYGRIPLHLAVQRGNLATVDALLPFSACINSKDHTGKTALDMAYGRPNAKMVASLIDYGADVNMNDRPSRRHDYEGPVTYDLNRHHVKMEIVGLSHLGLCPPINEHEILGLKDFYSECLLEVAGMKTEFVGDSDLSYYNVLKKNTSFVAKYMRNPSVVLALESEGFSVKYPIYAGFIRSRLRKAWAREKLLGLATQVFCRLCDLPDLCVERVLDFLDNDGLRDLLNLDV